MSGWPGYDDPIERPVVAVPVRPKSGRLRHGSEAYIPTQNTYIVDGNMLSPQPGYGRMQRSASLSAQRPTQIVINNDNNAYVDERDERPGSAYGHHRRSSNVAYDAYGVPIGRVRSNSRVRIRTPSPYYDDDDYDYEVEGYEGRRRRYHRGSSGPKRNAEDEAALKEYREMKQRQEFEERERKIKEEMTLKRLKEEKEEREREEEDKELKKKAIEEYKIKMAEEDAKKKKEAEEAEDKMIQVLLAGDPNMTEREARRMVRRGTKNQDRIQRGESPESRGDKGKGRGSRPTHIKVHRKYLSPETLDVYGLPWEYDERDSGYIIIKQWVSEYEQEILFDHTKSLKQRALLEFPRDRSKADSNQIVIIKKDDDKKRKKSPNVIKRTSWLLS